MPKYEGCQYDLTELPEGIVLMTEDNKRNQDVLKYSGMYPIPMIGDQVKINFNELGSGVVVSYFREHSFFGLRVKLDDAPEWHRNQHKNDPKHFGHALVTGQEITHLTYNGGPVTLAK